MDVVVAGGYIFALETGGGNGARVRVQAQAARVGWVAWLGMSMSIHQYRFYRTH